jgi:hypothetical protein
MCTDFAIFLSRHTDIRVTGDVLHAGDNKRIVLNCSVTGIHNTSNIVEIRFNDDESYSCRKARWPNEPEGSTDKPHVRFLDDTTCQLTIPNAAEANYIEYYCRVKLQLSPVSSKRNCYLLSETIIPSEEAIISDNDVIVTTEKLSTIHVVIIIIVPVLVVVLVLLSILPAVVVIKAMKYCHQERQRVQFGRDLRRPINEQGEFEGTHNA